MYRLTVHYDTPSDVAAFDEHYFEKHIPLSASVPGVTSVTFSKPKVLGPGVAPYLITEIDFEDEASFNAAMGSPEMRAVAKDADTLPAGRVMFVGELSER